MSLRETMIGFQFSETMSGSFQPMGAPADLRSFSFTIRARTAPLFAFMKNPFAAIEGEIDVERFADHCYLRGRLGLDIIRTGRLPYAFGFTANDGRRYAFEGTKALARGALVESLTVMPGVVRDADGVDIARALLRFDVRSDLGRFLRSFKAVY